MEAGRRVKEEGADNQLMALIAQDEMFHLDEAALEASLEPSKYVAVRTSGRALLERRDPSGVKKKMKRTLV